MYMQGRIRLEKNIFLLQNLTRQMQAYSSLWQDYSRVKNCFNLNSTLFMCVG